VPTSNHTVCRVECWECLTVWWAICMHWWNCGVQHNIPLFSVGPYYILYQWTLSCTSAFQQSCIYIPWCSWTEQKLYTMYMQEAYTASLVSHSAMMAATSANSSGDTASQLLLDDADCFCAPVSVNSWVMISLIFHTDQHYYMYFVHI
jgi:hypothetical protein